MSPNNHALDRFLASDSLKNVQGPDSCSHVCVNTDAVRADGLLLKAECCSGTHHPYCLIKHLKSHNKCPHSEK
ncbi:hypothetical protein ACEQ8H_006613 [Pleosporales sp. CAS-2024a]